MKHLKIATKLTVGFSVVLAIALIIGVVSVISLNSLATANNNMYIEYVLPPETLGHTATAFNGARTQYRSVVIYSLYDNTEKALSAKAKFEAHLTEFEEGVKQISQWADTDAERKLLSELNDVYRNKFLPSARETIDTAIADIPDHANKDRLETLIAENSTLSQRLSDIVEELSDIRSTEAQAAQADNTVFFETVFVFIIAIMFVAVVCVVFFTRYLSSLISKPLVTLCAFMKRAGTTSDITLAEQDREVIAKFAQSKDEIGHTIGDTSDFVNHITTVARELEAISQGDLTLQLELLSDKDVMGNSLKVTLEHLNEMFRDIHSTAVEVSLGAKQVSNGAQSLAQGSTEQAATIEQLSSSIAEIARKTDENAHTAYEASKLSESIKKSAQKGNSQMDEMMQAVKEINDASHSISKIIKTIDDIAFQTNILALNAAVEAARAGAAGKGFAVVAEEVRNLASKSAEAAKDTGVIIQNTIEKAEFGSKIADETAASLLEIVSGINESSLLVAQIASASEEQSQGISQINTGIDQVSQVVQQNTATAEESAASSREMSEHSSQLEELISRFKLRDNINKKRR